VRRERDTGGEARGAGGEAERRWQHGIQEVRGLVAE
jgi:hypothetical protein